MSKKKFKSWWILLFRGIVIAFFGIMILLQIWSGFDNPDTALIKLSVYFGWILFVIGVVNIAGAISQGGPRDDWNWLLSEGMLDLMIGGIIMVYPFMTGPIVLLVIAIWGLVSAIVQITNALINKKRLKNWWITVVNGIIMIFLVYLFMTNDRDNAATMVFALMGSTLCILGLMYIILSFSIKDMTPRKVSETRKEAADLFGEMKGIPKSK